MTWWSVSEKTRLLLRGRAIAARQDKEVQTSFMFDPRSSRFDASASSKEEATVCMYDMESVWSSWDSNGIECISVLVLTGTAFLVCRICTLPNVRRTAESRRSLKLTRSGKHDVSRKHRRIDLQGKWIIANSRRAKRIMGPVFRIRGSQCPKWFYRHNPLDLLSQYTFFFRPSLLNTTAVAFVAGDSCPGT